MSAQPDAARLKRRSFVKPWLLFFVLGTIGGNVVAVIVGSFVVTTVEAAGASEELAETIKSVSHFAVAMFVSYIVFAHVARNFIATTTEESSGRTNI